MNIKDALNSAKQELEGVCDSPMFEAELLLAYHLKKDRIYLHIHEDKYIENIDKYLKLVQRRADNEPYEYIVNSASFYDIELYVAEGVLIPRPETELLVDEVSKIIENGNIDTIVEIGIGSGAISIVLARKFPDLKIIATDISEDAIKIAKKNIKKFGLESRIEVIKTDLMDNIKIEPQLIVSNPPYIAKDFILKTNVVNYEPHSALFGGDRGDELLIKIIDIAHHLKNIKYLACEMGYDQQNSITNHLNFLDIKDYFFYQDLAGLDRGFVVNL